MRKLAQIPRISLLLLLAACIHEERPSDLMLEQVYVADISATSGFKAAVARGMLPPPLRLVMELSTAETVPLGRLSWSLCGEKKRPYYLFTATGPDAELDSGLSPLDQAGRHRYLAILAITFKLVPPSPELPNYDLRDDNRDICLNTGGGTYADVWSSNEVRVSRSLIEQALHEPPRIDVPLGPNQLP